MEVTLITCTGTRPEAFSLCEKYMKRQTYPLKNCQWIVIDDGPERTPTTLGQEYFQATRQWEPGLNTQRFNMEEVLNMDIKGEYIFIIEDDDWYHPSYLADMLWFLRKYVAVGEGNSKYYNLKESSWKAMRNTSSSSLCQTGFNRVLLPRLKAAVNSGDLYFDMHFWRQIIDNKLDSLIFTDKHLSIGIKGLPGRHGIGVGHTVSIKDRWAPDANWGKLAGWIGEDIKDYQKLKNKIVLNDAHKADTGVRTFKVKLNTPAVIKVPTQQQPPKLIPAAIKQVITKPPAEAPNQNPSPSLRPNLFKSPDKVVDKTNQVDSNVVYAKRF